MVHNLTILSAIASVNAIEKESESEKAIREVVLPRSSGFFAELFQWSSKEARLLNAFYFYLTFKQTSVKEPLC